MMNLAGGSVAQQSSEGLIQMMKKREKLNNSALSNKPGTGLLPPQPSQEINSNMSNPQFLAQLSKLYS